MSAGDSACDVRWRRLTPSRAGAIAMIEMVGTSADAIDGALQQIGVGELRTGDVKLRSMAGVDRGLVVRWSGILIHLMPHGGSAVVRALLEALTGLGIEQHHHSRDGSSRGPDCNLYPEAEDEIECRMLDALSCAQSPLAVDVLLAQPARWHAHSGGETAPDDLDRLIVPPLVVVRGPTNVGKSTLVNALAGRAVSVVADEPGTTRDHVGVMVNMAGLVVRLLDMPGERDDAPEIEREAMILATKLADGADLTLLCGDQQRPLADVGLSPEGESSGHQKLRDNAQLGGDALRLSLKADLGPCPWPSDHCIAAHSGLGLTELVEAVRDRLVSPASLTDPRPWRFWGASA